MIIPFLNRHLNICAQADLPRIGRMDPSFWNVVSIREPQRPLPDFRPFRSSHSVICYDIQSSVGLAPEEMSFAPRLSHLEGIFSFVDSTAGGPVLIHCWAGQSRSTAVALALIVRALQPGILDEDQLVAQAVETLLTIRSCASPNPLVLRLGLGVFMPEEISERLCLRLLNNPQLFENRHGGAQPGTE